MSFWMPKFVLAAVASAFLVSPSYSETQCAGRWRVSIETSTGQCQANEHSRAVMVTDNGNIQLVNPSEQLDLSGSVSACDKVSFIITRGSEIAKGEGQITGDEAKGTWVVTKPASKRCTGTWFARKHSNDS